MPKIQKSTKSLNYENDNTNIGKHGSLTWGISVFHSRHEKMMTTDAHRI